MRNGVWVLSSVRGHVFFVRIRTECRFICLCAFTDRRVCPPPHRTWLVFCLRPPRMRLGSLVFLCVCCLCVWSQVIFKTRVELDQRRSGRSCLACKCMKHASAVGGPIFCFSFFFSLQAVVRRSGGRSDFVSDFIASPTGNTQWRRPSSALHRRRVRMCRGYRSVCLSAAASEQQRGGALIKNWFGPRPFGRRHR